MSTKPELEGKHNFAMLLRRGSKAIAKVQCQKNDLKTREKNSTKLCEILAYQRRRLFIRATRRCNKVEPNQHPRSRGRRTLSLAKEKAVGSKKGRSNEDCPFDTESHHGAQFGSSDVLL